MNYEEEFFKISLENYKPTSVSDKVKRIRKVMIQYMNKLYVDFELDPQTFFIALSIFDTLIHKHWKILLKKNLRFIGITLLWISSKFEETYPLYFEDLFYITEHKKSKEEFLEFEELILKTIQYKIPRFTSYSILEQYISIYPILEKKDIFKRCLDTLIKKTYQENVSSLSVLELIKKEIN